MNLILFTAAELDRPLPRSDRRAVHLLEVLRRSAGDTFDAGIIDGPIGQATLETVAENSITLSFTPRTDAAPPEPITLLIGLPRPQTARDILRDATTLGVAALHFVVTERGELGYGRSTLWSSGEWRRHVVAGAEQAFNPRLPAVTWGQSLTEAIAGLAPGPRLALDNYESPAPLSQCRVAPGQTAITLAIGGERGWTAAERTLLRAQGFAFHHLGSRVLRTETACLAALTLVRARLGLI